MILLFFSFPAPFDFGVCDDGLDLHRPEPGTEIFDQSLGETLRLFLHI